MSTASGGEHVGTVGNIFINSGFSSSSLEVNGSSWPSAGFFSPDDVAGYPLNLSLRDRLDINSRELLLGGQFISLKFTACPLLSKSSEKAEFKSTIRVASLKRLSSFRNW